MGEQGFPAACVGDRGNRGSAFGVRFRLLLPCLSACRGIFACGGRTGEFGRARSKVCVAFMSGWRRGPCGTVGARSRVGCGALAVIHSLARSWLICGTVLWFCDLVLVGFFPDVMVILHLDSLFLLDESVFFDDQLLSCSFNFQRFGVLWGLPDFVLVGFFHDVMAILDLHNLLLLDEISSFLFVHVSES